MNILKKIIIFMVVSFKLLVYIINQTISASSLVAYLYVIVVFLLALPYLLNIKFNKESFCKTALIFIISFLMFAIFKEDNIFLYALVALISIDTDNKEIIKTFFYSGIIIYLLTIILGQVGILPIDEVYRTIDGDSQIRTSLGFPNANSVFTYFVPIVLAGLYLFDKKVIYNILVIILATILFSFCKSRTGYYLTILLVIVNLFPKKTFILKLKDNQFIFFTIISFLLAICYGNTKYNSVNLMLSGRPWYYLNFIKQGIFGWGHGVSENLILDNLYLRILANYSLIGFSLYYYIFNKGSKICKDNEKLLFSLFIMLLYGVFEAVTVVNFVITIFLKEIFAECGCEYEKN